MSLSTILNSCAKVRETGHGRWVACCPAHEDRSPSLAIRECDDGRILLNCFAGCETAEVLGTLGLDFQDIMPARLDGHRYKLIKAPFDARQVLECTRHEATVVALIAEQLAIDPDSVDKDRLLLATARLNTAIESTVPQYKHAVRC